MKKITLARRLRFLVAALKNKRARAHQLAAYQFSIFKKGN